MIKAVIDVGTNTFNLLIAEVGKEKTAVLHTLEIPVKLGRGGISKGVITPEAFERGMVALKEFRKEISRFNVTDILAVATSALRSAANGNEFIEEAIQRFSFPIRIIDGNEEATLIYAGAANSFELPDQNILVMDIGGGSVEFIIGRGGHILWKQSFHAGAARLISSFTISDPITAKEVEELQAYFRREFAPLLEAVLERPAHFLVGSAGSFETMRDVIRLDLGAHPSPLSMNACEVTLSDAERFCILMNQTTLLQKAQLKGMTDFRLEMITVAAVMINFIMKELTIQRLVLSGFSLKEGLLFSQR